MMQIGMLWLDDDKKRPFDEKVERAIDYYRDKYGRFPELCFVNQATLPKEKKVGRVKVQPANHVRQNHFWLGMKA
ncbi:MAG: hypothetical protein AAF614_15330 [Chloroflexota bacterium]